MLAYKVSSCEFNLINDHELPFQNPVCLVIVSIGTKYDVSMLHAMVCHHPCQGCSDCILLEPKAIIINGIRNYRSAYVKLNLISTSNNDIKLEKLIIENPYLLRDHFKCTCTSS